MLHEWVREIIVCSILLLVVDIISPRGGTRKYIKLISGFVIIIVIVNPMLSLLNREFTLDELITFNSFKFNESSAVASIDEYSEWQGETILKIYNSKIEGKISEIMANYENIEDYKVGVELDKDFESEKFGSVLSVDIEIRRIKENENPVNVKALKKEIASELGTEDEVINVRNFEKRVKK